MSDTMNWPLKEGWVCEVCGEFHGLTCMSTHAYCYCNHCHVQYWMRDYENLQSVVDTPLLDVETGWINAVKEGWKAWHRAIDDWTEADWDKAKRLASVEEHL